MISEAGACDSRQMFVTYATLGASSRSVAATVQQDLRLSLLDHVFGATDLLWLNAQSPSERSDGDCALSYETLNPFASNLGEAHNSPNRTVAAIEAAYLMPPLKPKEEST
jgi:hypothetical protein